MLLGDLLVGSYVADEDGFVGDPLAGLVQVVTSIV
jgi:hypothetical protein